MAIGKSIKKRLLAQAYDVCANDGDREGQDGSHLRRADAAASRSKGTAVRTTPGARRRRRSHVSKGEVRRALPPSLIPTLAPGSPAEIRRRPGRTKQAGFISENTLQHVVDHMLQTSRCPESEMAKLMLSHRAGLRAGEISQLLIRNVTDEEGKVAKVIFVGSGASKSRIDREVPVHRDLRLALERLIERYPEATHVAFSLGAGGRLRYQSPRSVAMWFKRLYESAGLHRCSSHSGRRSFATKIARLLDGSESSLVDLQRLLGHVRLSSTQCYLEPGQNIVNLVESMCQDITLW